MGVSGLLKHLKPAITRVELRKYKGQRVGVDVSVWIHRGAYSCAVQLVTRTPTNAYVNYVRNMCQLLLSNGLRPVLVFDGRSLPAKALTNARRREQREVNKACVDENLDAIRELEARLENEPRDSALQEALACRKNELETAAQRSVKVTDEMVDRVMREASEMAGVEVLRAPCTSALMPQTPRPPLIL